MNAAAAAAQFARPAVERDEEGLFLKLGENVFRPGYVDDLGRKVRMDDGGLQEGQQVVVSDRDYDVAGDNREGLRKISGGQGSVVWHIDDERRAAGLASEPSGASFDKEGKRLPFVERDDEGLFVEIPKQNMKSVPGGSMGYLQDDPKEMIKYRPGEMRGMVGTYKMGEAGISEGDVVDIRTLPNGLSKITGPADQISHWHKEGEERSRNLIPQNEVSQYRGYGNYDEKGFVNGMSGAIPYDRSLPREAVHTTPKIPVAKMEAAYHQMMDASQAR